MSPICQRVNSYFKSFDSIERCAMTGASLLSMYIGGPSLAIMELGAYLAIRKCFLSSPKNDLVVPPGGLRLDESTRLLQPKEAPTEIEWADNSCFCSSALWSFFTNEPAILNELPQAILRRVTALKSDPNVPAEIVHILGKPEPLTLKDFNELRETLERLEFEQGGFFSSLLNQLLSLLGLHHLIRQFQTSPSLSGDRVNEMRELAFRVNPGFRDRGSRIGDAHELFQMLGNLVFDKSKYMQTLITTRGSLTETNPNWGEIVLPMPSGTKPENLQSILDEYLNPKNLVPIEIGTPRKIHLVKETTRFNKAPPFIALTLKRTQHTPAKGVHLNMNPVEVGGQIRLDGHKYQLVAVSRRKPNMSHYDALVTRGDRWYACDDLLRARGQSSVHPINREALPEYLKTGYTFHYRKDLSR